MDTTYMQTLVFAVCMLVDATCCQGIRQYAACELWLGSIYATTYGER